MKTLHLFGALLLAGVNPGAAEVASRVTVCLENQTVVNTFVVERAKLAASAVFAEAGLRLEWSKPAACNRVEGSIFIQMDGNAPGRFLPGVMAYALPYGGAGSKIHVFYPRVVERSAAGFSIAQSADLLGHVMAHEITHVLQGVVRHSESGLMKAKWGPKDYREMRGRPLPMAGEDVMLVHLGLEKRAFLTLSATR